MKSIQLKISLFTGLATLVAIICLSAFSITSTQSLQKEVQEHTQSVVLQLFKKQLEARLENSAAHVAALFQRALIINDGIARSFISLKKTAQTSSDDYNLRNDFNAILKDALAKRPKILGVYSLWEPNALDNKDEEYRNKKADGYDNSGRFIPYWTLSGTGTPKVKALMDYNNYNKPNGIDRVGEYYLCPKDRHTSCLIEPYSYPINGVDTLLTSIVTPILINQEFVGITGIDVSLKSLESIAKELSDELYNGENRVFIVSHRGAIASDSLGQTTGKNIRDIFPDASKKLLNTSNDSNLELISSPDNNSFQAKVAINVGDNIPDWYLWVDVPKTTVLADLTTLNKFTSDKQFQQNILFVLAGLIIIVLSIVAIWWLSKQISRPIVNLTNFMEKVAEGDFRHRLESKSNDELGQLSDACNQFLDQIQPLLTQVVSSSDQIAENADQSAAISAETLEGANKQQDDVIQLASAVTELSATAQNVAENTITAADATAEIKSNVAQGQQVLNQANLSIESLAKNVQASSQVINRVSKDSQEIQTVMDVIQEIAEQTNLLALNAAIEAARAGEQGRGFAVVADEVRSLAKRTQESTAEIQSKIERLQNSALEAVNSMHIGSERAAESELRTTEANQKLKNIIYNIDELNDLIIQVSSAAEQQRAVTNSISNNVNNITAIATQTASGATNSNDSSQRLESHATHLKTLVAEFKL
ncbi:MAG: methyl-accepting chemotaxis protein [Marinomonas sp.]